MSTVSNEYKSICKSSEPTNMLGRIYVVEDDIYISESDDLVKFNVECDAFNDGVFFGTTITLTANGEIINVDKEYNIENKTIEIEAGVVLSDKTKEWYNFR